MAAASAAWAVSLAGFGFTSRPTWLSGLFALVAASVTAWRLHPRIFAGVLREPRTVEAWRVATAALTAAATLAVMAEVVNAPVGAAELALGGLGSIALLGTAVEVRARLAARRRPRRVAIVGTGSEARELAELIDDHPETGLTVIGCIGDRRTADRFGLIPRWLGPLDSLLEVLALGRVDVPIIASSSFRSPQLKVITNSLLASDYAIANSCGVSRIASGRRGRTTLSHEALEVIEPSDRAQWAVAAKRLLDIAVAGTMLLATAPIIALAMVAIAIESRGAVIFRQQRIGRDGRSFEMMKLRTMTIDAEARKGDLLADNDRNGPLFKLNHDPRVTRVGRVLRATSVDELPQLVSVLKGDMSLVGPRPALPEEVAQFDEELTGRTDVQPGITGLWQVEARSNPSFSAYRRLDLHYVENWSLLLDVKILLATFQMVAMGEAARIVCAFIERVAPTSRDPHVSPSANRRAAVADRSDDGGRRHIGILGSGFAGLQRAVRLLDDGDTVVVADTDTGRITDLKARRFIGCDRRGADALRAALDAGTVTFRADPAMALADCDEVFIYTATPRMPSGDLQLCEMRAAVAAIAPVLSPGAVVVVKPNVDDAVRAAVKNALANRSDVAVVNEPRDIDEFATHPAQSLGHTDEPLASVTELRSRTSAGGLRLVQDFAERPMADAT